MDPAFISSFDWHQIGILLRVLWAFVFSVVILGGALLLGHIAIPSLVESRHLPERVKRVRPFFYLAAGVALALALSLIANAVNLAQVIGNFYPRWWI